MTDNVSIQLTTPNRDNSIKVLLLGSGELGKEVAMELQRFGVEVIACDSYDHAPAMQVAHRSHTFSMLDAKRLEEVIRLENPTYIVPELEAIATDVLVKLEKDGFNIIPSAKATFLTMNREGIRKLAAEELNLPVSDYRFAQTKTEFTQAVQEIGLPVVVKPIMSSSGKGQSTVTNETQIEASWEYAQSGGRAGNGKVIIEGFVDFEYEITLLTVRHAGGTAYLEPIGHRQVKGDYHESWQPQPMSALAWERSVEIAKKITDALGGRGLFGVELFVKGDDVWFSEVSPRPHDTGMVTMISQNVSEFGLHARAILGMELPKVEQFGPAASYVILVEGESEKIQYKINADVLAGQTADLRLFGKPSVKGQRRMGVALAKADTIEAARALAKKIVESVKAELS